MSRDKQIVVAGVVLVGLIGAGFYVVKKDQQIGSATTTKADLPEMKVGEDVDKISITNAGKGEVVLEKKGEKWELSKPLSFPANQQSVKSLLDNMKELKAKEQISSTLTDEQKKDFQFDDEHAVHVSAFKGGEKKGDFTFGKPGQRGQLATIDGKPGVFAVSGYSSYLYTREVKGWRDTEIFKFDDANANAVSITNKNGTFSFTKGEKWSGTYKGAPIDRFDDAKVADFLRIYKGLAAEDFGDGKSPADTGLDKPEATVTVTLKDNAGKYTVNVGKVSSGTSHFAQKDGSPTVVVLSAGASDWALADVSKFQKALPAADAGAKPPVKK